MSASAYSHGELKRELPNLYPQRPRHDYDIVQLHYRPGSREYIPSAGAIYPRIAKLQSKGLTEEVATDRRRVLGITPQGREALARSRPRHQGSPDPLGSVTARHADIARDMLGQPQEGQERIVEEVLLMTRLRAVLDNATRSLTASSPASVDQRDELATTHGSACHPLSGGIAMPRKPYT